MQNLEEQSAELEVALQAARAAGEISRRYYHGNFKVTTKADRTPVTQADVDGGSVDNKVTATGTPITFRGRTNASD